MATSDSFLMDSLSDSLLAAVTETSFYGCVHPPIAEKPTKPLAELKLPSSIIDCYRRLGITHLFAWQAECLEKASASGKRNFIFSAPASAGKTIVSELLLIKSILETKRKALFIEPYVSIVQEKAAYFRKLFSSLRLNVASYAGSSDSNYSFLNSHIIICTIEKANSIINRLLSNHNDLNEIGIIIVDELHWIGEVNRGYLLEILLSKIIYYNQLNQSIKEAIQIIGMSATISNLDELGKWVNADVYETKFRPIPLDEYIKIDSVLYNKQFIPARQLNLCEQWNQGDSEGVTEIIWNVIEHNGRSVLVFCSTKHWCEVLAKLLAKNFRRIIDDKNFNPFDKIKLDDVMEQLRRTPTGLDHELACSIPMGVAFHHAGLTIDERDIIENAYRANIIRVIVCTSTLSTGVNLPARLVIIRSPLQNGRCIDLSTYLQMVGRAGRKGYDDYAESILICSKKEIDLVQKMFEQEKNRIINSCFMESETSSYLKRALIEIVASGKANTKNEIITYVKSTFFYVCINSKKSSIDEQIKLIEKCLFWLCDNELVRCIDKENVDDENNLRYEPTQLALAIVSASINPDDGLKLIVELNKAQRNLCLENDLHLIYLIIPQHLINSMLTNLDWNVYHTIWPTGAIEQHVAHLVGVNGMIVYKKAASLRIEKREYEEKLDGPRYVRFFIALILNDLLSEKNMCDIIKKYECSKSLIQQLQQTTATFTSIVQTFAERLSWNNLKQLLHGFQARLNFGIKQELCELVRISILNGCRARQLYSDGFTTIASLANGNIYEIERSIQKAVPFQTEAQQKADEKVGQERRDRYCIFVAGRQPLTNAQAAREIIEEAKILLQNDLRAMGFGMIIKSAQNDTDGGITRSQDSSSETDSDDGENDNYEHRISSIQFPCLLNDKNINIRNVYVDRKHICSEFILMIEHKETVAISCFTKKIKRKISDSNVFHIDNQEELHLHYVACAFSTHKIFIIDVTEDEQYFQQHRMSALIHLREKLFNRKHNIIVFNSLRTLFTLSSYLSIPRIYARIIDLQVCSWLKQDPIEFNRVLTWIKTHHTVLHFDENLKQYDSDENRYAAYVQISGEVLLYASIVPIIEQQMNQIHLWNYYTNIEMPALKIILQMLLNGILINHEQLIREREDLINLMNKLELQAYRLVKRRFKLNRTNDLIKIFYDELHLPIEYTPHGRISLKKSYLNVLADKHPLPKLITEYRQVQSALDRCIDRFEQSIHEPTKPQSLQRLRREASWQNERTYATCHFLTVTGRMMIMNPPLQHIPKRFTIRCLNKESTVRLRQMIIARKDFQLVSFDYSQLELRVLAHLSNDENLQIRLKNDADFFVSLAAELLKTSENQITHEHRQHAKQVCYGILYGMTTETFARETRMKFDRAQEFIENFYQTFPTMTKYLNEIKQYVLEKGYVQSICGRPLYFDLNRMTSNSKLKAQMERQAINFVIQASACDIMKMAMERINQTLDQMFPFDLKTRPTPIRPVYFILQIHDELMFEIEMNSRTNEIISRIRHEMEINDHIHLFLPVQVKSGDNWESMICNI